MEDRVVIRTILIYLEKTTPAAEPARNPGEKRAFMPPLFPQASGFQRLATTEGDDS